MDSRPTDHGNDGVGKTTGKTRRKTMKKTERGEKKFLFRILPTYLFEIKKFSITQKRKDTKNFLFIEKNPKGFSASVR